VRPLVDNQVDGHFSGSNAANEDRSAVVAALFDSAAADNFNLELLDARQPQPDVKLRQELHWRKDANSFP
jgi:hypothetical protein